MMDSLRLSALPGWNAVLNATSAVLLLAGYSFIRRRRIRAHKFCMVAAFVCSAAFLVSYIYFHAHAGVVYFQGHGLIRRVYFTLLVTHTILAVVIVPLVLITLYRALTDQFERHRRIACWTLPLWLYVSVTGVIIYWLLYQVYAVNAARNVFELAAR